LQLVGSRPRHRLPLESDIAGRQCGGAGGGQRPGSRAGGNRDDKSRSGGAVHGYLDTARGVEVSVARLPHPRRLTRIPIAEVIDQPRRRVAVWLHLVDEHSVGWECAVITHTHPGFHRIEALRGAGDGNLRQQVTLRGRIRQRGQRHGHRVLRGGYKLSVGGDPAQRVLVIRDHVRSERKARRIQFARLSRAHRVPEIAVDLTASGGRMLEAERVPGLMHHNVELRRPVRPEPGDAIAARLSIQVQAPPAAPRGQV
jgi:hypothetical protein